MFHKTSVIICVLIVAILTGCWIPEKFDAKVVINKDGSYTFSYDGTLTYALALAAAQKGELSAKDEADLKQEASKIAREPGFKSVDYQGKGRYKVVVEKNGRPGEPYYFISKNSQIFAIVPENGGSISVSAIRPDKKALQEMNSIGAKIDGTLTVSVARGAKVLKHNAQSQPSVFGLFGGYKWQIKSPDENPFIVIQPSS